MRKLIITFLIYFFVLLQAISQTYSFQHIGVEEGLSQSVITSISQDKDGVFWIGTMSGLTRYDGNEYSVLGKENGMAENWVTSSLKDANGNLWLGHWGGGVTFYDTETGLFEDMKFERFSRYKSISEISQDNNGDIWFATKGAGIFKYESKENAIVTLSKEDGFLSNIVNAIEVDLSGNIWFGTNMGIAIYMSSKKLEDEGAFVLLSSKDGLASNFISDLEVIDETIMVVATEFDGISVVKGINDVHNLSVENLNKSNGFISNEIICLLKEDNENIWIGTGNEGVLRYNLNNHKTTQFSTRQGLNYFKVNHIFKDREENVWIGTDLGLNLFRGDEFLIYNESDGIINNVIWSIAEDQKNRMWMGTNYGLSRVTFIENKLTGQATETEIKNFTTQDGLSDNVILSIFIDNSDNVWCGTGYGGVTVLNDDGNILYIIDSVRGLASNTIFSINQDEKGNIWLGTDKGVSEIGINGEITNYTSKEGLGGDNIYKIFTDSKNNIWFASIGGYLSKLKDGKFIRFDDEGDLSQMFITSIAEDKEGNIWFGAYGGGILKYDGKDFKNFTTNDGLSSNSPYSLLVDDYNNLWIGNGKGVDKFNLENYTTKNYREKEGFLGVEPNPNAVCKDHLGNIWFGTIMGAVKFNLSQEKKNMTEPITLVETIKIAHEPFEFPDNQEFSYNENHITFHYIGISLTNPEHNEYKFMLENFDANWSPITKEQDVIYSNLPPGSYTFKVKSSNNDGIWNELPTSYSFVINPPFWKTWWFYVLSAIIIMTLIYFGDEVRMKKIKADKEILEKTVDERTAEVVEQKKVVEGKNKEIMASIKYAQRIQQAILPPTNLVNKFLSENFILYKPKDVVAGDFYWFETRGDDIFIAAADCTGHGVPGAMVSVVCANALNRVVNEMNILEPAKILDKTRELVLETFQKSEQQVNDGMDISFCKINLKTMKLTYTGAHNPVYRVTPINGEVDEKILKNETHMLLEYKGDKQPIGEFAFSKPFTQEEISLKKGDILYLSTDGFADQFGGAEERKFMYTPFKKMFLSIHDLSFEEQKNVLDETFHEWKKNVFQVDDVCIIGLKIV